MTVTDRIKLARCQMQLTQDQFAARIGVSKNYVSLLESGKRNPSMQVILSICREYGVSEQWLRTGEGAMFSPHDPDAEIANFFADVGSDSFRRRFVAALAALDDDAWSAIEQFAQSLVDNNEH